MKQKWHIFHKVDIFSKMLTFTWKHQHILRNVDIYSNIWTYIHKCGHIIKNVDIYPKMWTQCQKSGQKHTKADKILENDTFDLSKSGIGYSVGA